MGADIALAIFFFVLGVLASVAWWWLTTHYWAPRLKFSAEIAEYALPDGDRIWLAEIENAGRRAIIDMEIVLRVAIKGFKGTEDTAYHTLVTNASHIPRFGAGFRRKVRLFDMREEPVFKDVPSRPLREAIITAGTLPAVFGLGTSAHAQLHVIGYDEWSGARKVLSSHRYTAAHIRKGTLRDLHVVAQTSPWLGADPSRPKAAP